MTVYFETDVSITNKGFVLYYTAGSVIFLLSRNLITYKYKITKDKTIYQTYINFFLFVFIWSVQKVDAN